MNRWMKFVAAMLGVFLAAEAGLAPVVEANFWQERRRAAGPSRSEPSPMAALPGGADFATVLKGLPAVQPTALSPNLIERLKADVSAPVLRRHTALLRAIPPAYGAVRRLSSPAVDDGKTVVFLQDVHKNDEAQANLGQIVESLAAAGPDARPGLVALEAAFAPLNLDRFRAFEDQGAVRMAADYLLKERQISGPVHAAYTLKGDIPPFLGVDDPVHYKANVEAYRRSAPAQEGARFQLAAQRYRLEQRKKAAFNDELLAFDRVVAEYRSGRLAFGDYIETLAGGIPSSAPSGHLPPRGEGKAKGFPSPLGRGEGEGEISSFLQALRMEKSLDFAQVEKERTRLIEDVVRKLPRPEVGRLLQLSVAYRVGSLTHTDYYRVLRDLCGKNGVALAAYPAMDGYVRYVILAGRINADKLLKEARSAEEAAYGRLANTDEEKGLVAASRRLALADKLLDFSLTPDEWEDYGADRHPGGSRAPGVEPSLSDASDSRVRRNDGGDFSSFESFYQEADARNRAMTENLLKAMKEKNAGSAVLVAGGFHTTGMTKLLTERGVTVIEVAPKLTKVDGSGSAYLGVFTQEKTPLEQIFKGDRLFVNDTVDRPGLLATVTALAVGVRTKSADGAQRAFTRLSEGARLLAVRLRGDNRAEARLHKGETEARVSLEIRDGAVRRFTQLAVVGFSAGVMILAVGGMTGWIDFSKVFLAAGTLSTAGVLRGVMFGGVIVMLAITLILLGKEWGKRLADAFSGIGLTSDGTRMAVPDIGEGIHINRTTGATSGGQGPAFVPISGEHLPVAMEFLRTLIKKGAVTGEAGQRLKGELRYEQVDGFGERQEIFYWKDLLLQKRWGDYFIPGESYSIKMRHLHSDVIDPYNMILETPREAFLIRWREDGVFDVASFVSAAAVEVATQSISKPATFTPTATWPEGTAVNEADVAAFDLLFAARRMIPGLRAGGTYYGDMQTLEIDNRSIVSMSHYQGGHLLVRSDVGLLKTNDGSLLLMLPSGETYYVRNTPRGAFAERITDTPRGKGETSSMGEEILLPINGSDTDEARKAWADMGVKFKSDDFVRGPLNKVFRNVVIPAGWRLEKAGLNGGIRTSVLMDGQERVRAVISENEAPRNLASVGIVPLEGKFKIIRKNKPYNTDVYKVETVRMALDRAVAPGFSSVEDRLLSGFKFARGNGEEVPLDFKEEGEEITYVQAGRNPPPHVPESGTGTGAQGSRGGVGGLLLSFLAAGAASLIALTAVAQVNAPETGGPSSSTASPRVQIEQMFSKGSTPEALYAFTAEHPLEMVYFIGSLYGPDQAPENKSTLLTPDVVQEILVIASASHPEAVSSLVFYTAPYYGKPFSSEFQREVIESVRTNRLGAEVLSPEDLPLAEKVHDEKLWELIRTSPGEAVADMMLGQGQDIQDRDALVRGLVEAALKDDGQIGDLARVLPHLAAYYDDDNLKDIAETVVHKMIGRALLGKSMYNKEFLTREPFLTLLKKSDDPMIYKLMNEMNGDFVSFSFWLKQEQAAKLAEGQAKTQQLQSARDAAQERVRGHADEARSRSAMKAKARAAEPNKKSPLLIWGGLSALAAAAVAWMWTRARRRGGPFAVLFFIGSGVWAMGGAVAQAQSAESAGAALARAQGLGSVDWLASHFFGVGPYVTAVVVLLAVVLLLRATRFILSVFFLSETERRRLADLSGERKGLASRLNKAALKQEKREILEQLAQVDAELALLSRKAIGLKRKEYKRDVSPLQPSDEKNLFNSFGFWLLVWIAGGAPALVAVAAVWMWDRTRRGGSSGASLAMLASTGGVLALMGRSVAHAQLVGDMVVSHPFPADLFSLLAGKSVPHAQEMMALIMSQPLSAQFLGMILSVYFGILYLLHRGLYREINLNKDGRESLWALFFLGLATNVFGPGMFYLTMLLAMLNRQTDDQIFKVLDEAQREKRPATVYFRKSRKDGVSKVTREVLRVDKLYVDLVGLNPVPMDDVVKVSLKDGDIFRGGTSVKKIHWLLPLGAGIGGAVGSIPAGAKADWLSTAAGISSDQIIGAFSVAALAVLALSRLLPYLRNIPGKFMALMGGLMNGARRLFRQALDNRKVALAVAALIAVSAAQGRPATREEAAQQIAVLSGEPMSEDLNGFLGRAEARGVPVGPALLERANHWTFKYDVFVGRPALQRALKKQRLALDGPGATRAVARAGEREVPAAKAVSADAKDLILITRVLRDQEDVPGLLALLAEHKENPIKLEVLAREGSGMSEESLSRDLAGFDQVSLTIKTSRGIPQRGSRQAIPESVTADGAAPWLDALKTQNIRPGGARYVVSYPADLELEEGVVPALFIEWSAERIRSTLEKAFKIEYQNLSNIGWLAHLVAQMA